MANPNPSPRTRIGAPNGPKPGKTTATARLEVLNAEAAMRIRARILAAAEAKLVECSTDDVLAQYVETAMLKLLTDSETRGLGAPVQPVDHSSTDGSMTPKPGVDLSKAPPELLEWIVAQNDAAEQE